MRKILLGVMIVLFSICLNANIVFSPNQIYLGQKVTFSIDQSKGCTNCKWDFGDGTIINNVADNIHVEHAFSAPGTYTITFTPGGCIETPPSPTMLVITVLDNRAIVLTPNNPKIHTNIKLELKNSIKTPIQWNFGDGTNISGSSTVYHTYQNPGNYTITAIDSGALNSPVVYNVNILQDPRLVIYTPSSPTVSDNINFTAKSFQKDNIKWDFGDGIIQNGGKNISHKYSNPGNYNIKVYDNGGNDNYPIILKINILKDMRNIIFYPKQASEGENISFTAKQFKSSNILWDFGDGIKKTGHKNIQHFYRRIGNYTIKVFDNGGNDNNPIITNISIARDLRKITWIPKKPFSKEPVKFRLLYVNSNDFKWDFGDGTKKRGFGKEILHTYNREGIFTIKVFDTKGDYGTPVFAKITVLKDPRKVESAKKTTYVGEKVNFKALNFKSSNLKWDFGDSVKKIGGNDLFHAYKKQGLFKVFVKEANKQNGKTFSVMVQVLPDPRKLEILTKEIKVGKEIEIKAVNFYSDKILWDFGDSVKKIDGKTVKHIYRKTGVFIIKAIDYAGKDTKIFKLTTDVKITLSQSSDLIISGGEFFFKNNYKNFLIVPKDYKGIKAIAKIKFEGTGNLTAYWLIDDHKYSAVNKNLSFGQKQSFTFKNIPTLLIGLHKIDFSVLFPKTDFKLNGYYFVSPVKKRIILLTPKDDSLFGSVKLKFKWKPIKREIRYIFKVSSDIEGLFKKPKIIKKISENFISVHTGILRKGIKYYWIVEAKDSGGNVMAISDIGTFKIKE